MSEDVFDKLLEKYIPSTYIQQARNSRKSREILVTQLLEKRKWPEEGWDDATIENLLARFASMDSNNFPRNCGVGEREARIFSSLVARRHFQFGHGIGRSGDLVEIQPKAAGSSTLYKLTNALALDALRTLGVNRTKAAFVTPLATGMSLSLVFLTLRLERPHAKYIIWSRIDQKSCFKSIITSGFEPIIVPPILCGDELRTDTVQMETILKERNIGEIACVFTTTSCFAPRSCDDVETVATLCQQYDVPHVINNAYGTQSSKCMHLIQQASRVGRIDAYVQSTDKNFLVPVGGSIIAGFDEKFIAKVGQCYPGRASASPILDLFITLLSMGSLKYRELVRERKELHQKLKDGMGAIACKHSLRILETPGNSISVAMTLPLNQSTELGSKLFLRCVSGTRVVMGTDSSKINGIEFKGWGAHINNYPQSYLTAAASVGMTQADIDLFLRRLDKVITESAKVSITNEYTD